MLKNNLVIITIKTKIKFIMIPYIALGMVLSNTFGISYISSAGGEWHPYYLANPFLHIKQGTHSLEAFYNIEHTLLNWVIWTVIVSILYLIIKKLSPKKRSWQKPYNIVYIGIVTLYFLWSSLSIFLSLSYTQGSFDTQEAMAIINEKYHIE